MAKPKTKPILGAIAIAGFALCGPAALADWSSITDFFKSESNKTIDSGALGQAADAVGLSQDEIAKGLKEALADGVGTAVSELGRPDGFLQNAEVKIPMPEHLSMVEKGLRALGQDQRADQFVESMNRAAERAVPEAAGVFGDAISDMSIDDAKAILNGGDTAATEYLKASSTDALRSKFRPVVDGAIDQVGATQQYQSMVDKAGIASSFIDTEKLDLGNYVTDKTLDGVFTMIGAQEQKIRADPAARTSELLKKVFAR